MLDLWVVVYKAHHPLMSRAHDPRWGSAGSRGRVEACDRLAGLAATVLAFQTAPRHEMGWEPSPLCCLCVVRCRLI